MFSPTDAAFEGFRLTREKPLTVLVGWPLVFLVAIGLMIAALLAAIGPAGLQELQAVTTSAEASKNPAAAFAAIGRMAGVLLLVVPLALLFSAMTYGAVFRAVLRPQEGGFFYFRLGGDELRLLLVNFVLSLLFGIVALIAFAVLGVIAGLTGAGANQSGGALVGVVGGIVLALAFIWIAIRLSLALPITFVEKRIAIFDSWSLTKGRFWPLLGMALLAIVFVVVVSFLGSLVSGALVALTGGGFAALAEVQKPDLADLAPSLALPLILYVVTQLILGSLQTAIMYAPFAVAYRSLKGA